MRRILLSLLLATTVATPALAQRPDREDRAAARQERKAERSEARQERSQQAPAERSQAPQEHSQAPADRSQARQDRVEVRQDRVEARQQRVEARPEQMQGNDSPVRQVVRERVVRDNRPVMNVNDRGRPALEQRQDARGDANWRRDQRDVTQQQIEQRAERNRVRVPVGARPDRPAPPPETAYNSNRHPEWRTDWRRDHRYDWRNYRHHHRSTFHLGIYFDPFGWGYQRYGIGWRLWPSYYSSNYWLSDPYMYRLPYAPFPYKWVRYYDDALLVNIYTGQVVDVMYDFFW
jgi:hypothetical protein